VDPILNPFTPGAGVPPRVWVDRDRELEQAAVLFGRLSVGNPERSIVLTGLRGVGKTVLLGRMRRLAENQGWLTASFEAQADVDLRDELLVVGRRFLETVDPVARMASQLDELRRWLPRMSVAGIDIDAAPSPESGLERDVVGLVERLGAAARAAGTGVALFVDELQDTPEPALAALCAAMHRAAQDSTPVALVGAGLPTLPGVLARAKSYAERLFTYPSLGRLDAERSKAAIRGALAELELSRGVPPRIDAGALEAIVAFAEGYPMFLQSIGKHAWAHATAPTITAADVAAAEGPAMRELADDLFTSRWQRATRRQRDYIAAIARAGGQAASGAAAVGAGYPSSAEASPVRDELIGKGIIYAPQRGRLAFTVPKFDRFVMAYLERET
jgi:hypothetical protein